MIDLDNAKRILDRPYDEDWPGDVSKVLREAIKVIERLRKGREGARRPIEGHCRLCSNLGALYFLELYVMGSEGSWVCLACRMVLTDTARAIQHTAGRVRLAVKLEEKKKRDT